jgi:hypothetical protein
MDGIIKNAFIFYGLYFVLEDVNMSNKGVQGRMFSFLE